MSEQEHASKESHRHLENAYWSINAARRSISLAIGTMRSANVPCTDEIEMLKQLLEQLHLSEQEKQHCLEMAHPCSASL